MRYIDEISNKQKNRNKVIFCGPGVGLDSINLIELRDQLEYDIFTLSDALKAFQKVTYAFFVPYRSLVRSVNCLSRAQYLLIHKGICSKRLKSSKPKETIKRAVDLENFINKLKNVYRFKTRPIKASQLQSGLLDLSITNNSLIIEGHSAIPAFHFLAEFIKYKEIYYVGFDGGRNYSKLVHYERKKSKIIEAEKDYEKSWKAIINLSKLYKEISFEPLKKFLK